MKANDFQRVVEMYRTTATRPEAFSDDDIEVYKEALRQPGALTASLNYYRANVFRSLRGGAVETPKGHDGRIRVPTLFIYGEHDMAVLPATVKDLSRFIDAPYREVRIPDSGHWVQNEAVSEVNQALLEFLGDQSAGPRHR
jgi:pimeloyl-ACP methyl ester carboxylesterase